MATIAKPQVLVFQQYTITPAEGVDPLRAHISGPNGKLHRYSDVDEKALIGLGEYDRLNDACYSWPGRTAGSLVDEDYTQVFLDDALLLYHQDLIGDTSGGRGTVQPVDGHPNWVRSSTLSYKTNGTSHVRSGLFIDRDVKIGDKVYVRGVVGEDDECEEIEIWSAVAGFASEVVDSEVQAGREDAANAETTAASAAIEQTAGPENCVTATIDGADYNGLASGNVCETYVITVIKSSIAGCNAARLRVVSASGTDDHDEVEPAEFGEPTAIGAYGLEVTFDVVPGVDCSASAEAAAVEPGEFSTGQTWEATVCQAFERVCVESGGTYAGPVNDVYVVEVTKGGLWADLPEISVSTAKGLDFSGPTEVTGPNTAVSIGSNGVTLTFRDCFGSSSASAAAAGESFGGDSTLSHGLRLGDKFYVTVISESSGAVQTLILRHDLPTTIWDAADLDLQLFILKDIEVSENRLSNPPEVQWEQEATQVCLKLGMTGYDAAWTDNGVPQPMEVYGGALYVQYREWLSTLTGDVTGVTLATIDDIPGQLDPGNPLKYGAYVALLNSNSATVWVTAVADPNDLDSWQDVIERIDGRDDMYNFVPLTYDQDVLNLFAGQAEAESSPEAGNWKATFFGIQAVSAKLVVGFSAADAQALTPTSTDGEVVLAVLEDNPQATGTQYTRLRVPLGNAGFMVHEVAAGDIVRFIYATDDWGDESYTEFVVDSVLSENILTLLDGHSVAVSEPQKIEVWHTLTRNEIVTDLKEQAQDFATRRVCAVWPDLLGVNGVTVPGYFLCAALAGLVSGVAPHQGLTNVEVAGFDDYSRSTKFFSATQLNELQDGGVWIVTEDRNGTPHTYHALTTDLTDVNSREEMIRRNVDSMSYLFLRRLRPFIGRTNVTPSMLTKLEYETLRTIDYLKGNGYTDDLGSQLIEGTITLVRQHPLLADRVEIVLNLIVPAPLNNIECHLIV